MLLYTLWFGEVFSEMKDLEVKIPLAFFSLHAAGLLVLKSKEALSQIPLTPCKSSQQQCRIGLLFPSNFFFFKLPDLAYSPGILPSEY